MNTFFKKLFVSLLCIAPSAQVIAAIVDLPADLLPVYKAYLQEVADPEQQPEFFWTAERLDLQSRDSADVNAGLLVQEMKHNPKGFITNDVRAYEFVAEQNTNKLVQYGRFLRTLSLEENAQFLPFFCSVRQDDPDNIFNPQACIDAVVRVLESAQSLNKFVVSVSGERYGQEQRVSMYIQSRVDANVFMRLSFDIIHEL